MPVVKKPDNEPGYVCVSNAIAGGEVNISGNALKVWLCGMRFPVDKIFTMEDLANGTGLNETTIRKTLLPELRSLNLASGGFIKGDESNDLTFYYSAELGLKHIQEEVHNPKPQKTKKTKLTQNPYVDGLKSGDEDIRKTSKTILDEWNLIYIYDAWGYIFRDNPERARHYTLTDHTDYKGNVTPKGSIIGGWEGLEESEKEALKKAAEGEEYEAPDFVLAFLIAFQEERTPCIFPKGYDFKKWTFEYLLRNPGEILEKLVNDKKLAREQIKKNGPLVRAAMSIGMMMLFGKPGPIYFLTKKVNEVYGPY